jgi:CBS domain-containing protein
MLVKDVMKTPTTVQTEETLEVVALRMKRENVGGLPVCEGSELVGVVTDRDIAVRAVAEHRNPTTTKAGQVMSAGVLCCSENDTIQKAVGLMNDHHLQRLPAVDGDRNVVGLISLNDLSGRPSRRAPFEVLFYKILVDSTGHCHNVELTRVAVSHGSTREDAVATAIRHFEREKQITSWQSLADGYEVVEAPADPGGAAAQASELTEQIRRRAYELWENEGYPTGHHEAHWHKAFAEVTLALGAAV